MADAASPRKPSLSLKARALKYLAGRELSRDGLRRKLQPHVDPATHPPEAVEQLLDELASRGFLSNERFAESLVHRRAAQFGTRRLRDELSRQGIEPALVSAVLAGVQDSEFERARQLWLRRYGELAADDAGRARQARFLLARGFSPDVVQRLVRGRWDEAL